MNVILNYTMILALQSATSLHSDEIETAIINYTKDLHNFNAAILTNDAASWDNIHLPFPVVRRSLTTTQPLYLSMYLYILDLHKFHGSLTNQLQLLNRNSNSKFIALVNENKNAAIKEMKKFGLCNVMVLSANDTYFEAEEVYDPCKGMGGMPKDTDQECRANASVMSFPPATFYESSTAISGYEGLMFRTSCESFGLKMNYINRSEKIGQANPPAFGTLGDVVKGKSMAGFGVLYSLKIRYDYMDGIQMCADADFSWAVHSRAGKRHPTWFIVLVTEFSSTVWLCLLITYFILVFSYFLTKNAEIAMWPFDILALIIGYPLDFENNRVFKILVIIFGFTITAHYKTMMSSKLTVPTPIPEINTNKELSEAGFRLIGAPSLGLIFKGISESSPEDPVSADIARRYENSMVELKYHLLRIAEKNDIAVTRSSDNIYYIAEKDNRTAGEIHVLEEPMIQFRPTTYLTKHGCLTAGLSQQYNRLCASGLPTKWYQDSKFRKPPPEKGPRKLAVEHIKGFILLWMAGCIVATLAFLGEILIYKGVAVLKLLKKKRLRRNWPKKFDFSY